MSVLKVFIVDDERILRVSMADDLRERGYKVFEFANAGSTLGQILVQEVDVIFTDIKMPQMDGIEFLAKVKEIHPEITVVIMTAYGSIETAVKAIKLGAYDYITKPFQSDEIFLMLERIKELRDVQKDNKQLRAQIQSKYDFSSFIGNSNEMKEVFNLVKAVANTSTTILISGETGTGKELLTNIIHYNSNRKKQHFIKVSCAILSREIFESELFGHVKGAFTGADKEKQGRFELANNGTLYLDDVDDIPLDLQVKLLRVIEEQEVERVGSSEAIKIDIRIIASTKVDLKKLVEEGKFREDLFYRLNVFPIHILPIRERKKDIPDLINYFVKESSQGQDIKIQKEVFDILINYKWLGNVRELKNLIERMVLLAHNNIINVSKIPYEIRSPSFISNYYNCTSEKNLEQTLSEIEINTIETALQKCRYNKTKAAELLGLPPSTLRTKMDKYGIG